jgi:putative transcriptional regulator
MKLKNHIKQHRARMNYTQKELAELTGVSRQTINTVEKGRFIPSTLLALKIADALKMRVDNLFELVEESKHKTKKETNQKTENESFIKWIQKSRFNE